MTINPCRPPAVPSIGQAQGQYIAMAPPEGPGGVPFRKRGSTGTTVLSLHDTGPENPFSPLTKTAPSAQMMTRLKGVRLLSSAKAFGPPGPRPDTALAPGVPVLWPPQLCGH